MDGYEVTEPNKTDYCLGEKHHRKLDEQLDGESVFGYIFHSRSEFEKVSIIKGQHYHKDVVDL